MIDPMYVKEEEENSKSRRENTELGSKWLLRFCLVGNKARGKKK